ncbi:MAG: metal-sensitive transcriptional regulator [Chloroflexi bacterium]|jgi:DNA-binding FrmR family transcriptional regulator|nr:metal-sensitive transcriptional regulator [Anaerolineaceae bacterium]NMB89743.1 metal-sensitive transcriptional regulator [Chloroflexota bacterium]
MQLSNTKAKGNILARLRRIEGQVRGIENMIENERDCHEIMQQLASVRSAVQGVSLAFLQEYATDCLIDPPVEDRQQRKQMVDDLIQLLGKVD